MFGTKILLFCSSDLADDSPPEPAPPEVPPRGPSLHHPLQGHATLRGRSGGSTNYSLSSGPGDADNLDDPDYARGASAAGGNACMFLSQGRDSPLLGSSKVAQLTPEVHINSDPTESCDRVASSPGSYFRVTVPPFQSLPSISLPVRCFANPAFRRCLVVLVKMSLNKQKSRDCWFSRWHSLFTVFFFLVAWFSVWP